MRGIVYRRGSRRAVSIVLAMAVALIFGGGSASLAAAKGRADRAAGPAAKRLPIAHATGHKIA
jgi:hypothetical protein